MTSFYFFIGTLLLGFIIKSIGTLLLQTYGSEKALVISTLIDKYVISTLVAASILWMAYDLFSSLGTYIYNYIMNF